MAAGTAELQILVKARDEASGALGGIQGKLSKLANVAKVAGIGAGIAVAGLGVAAVKMASEFETAFAEVTTLFDAPQKQVDALQQGVLDLSSKMGIDAVETTKALYQAISAGVEPAKALAFIEQNAKLAVGGVTDLGTSVDLTTTLLNAFGLAESELEAVSDSMFTAVRLGKTTVEELGAAMFNVAPVAATMGVNIDEVGAALAVLTAKGVPTSVATTQLRQAILSLAAPTKRQKAALDELGLSFDADTIASQGLAETFNQLAEAADGDDALLRRLVGSTEALQAVLALGGEGADEFAAALAEMENKGGSTDAAFEKMNATFGRQVSIIKTQLKNVLISVGLEVLPLLTRALERLNPWLQEKLPKAIAFMRQKWVELQPKIDEFVAFLESDLMPIIRDVISLVETSWPIIAEVIDIAAARVIFILETLANSIRFIMAIVRGDWDEAWQQIKNQVESTWRFIHDTVSSALNILNMLTGGKMFEIAGAVLTAFQSIRDSLGGIWGGITGAAQTAWNTLKDIILGSIARIRGGIADMLQGAKDAADAFPGPNPFGNAMQAAIDKLRPGGGAPAFTQEFNDFINSIPGLRGFAGGGVVPGPVGSPQLAVVHGGETISPAGGCVNVTIIVNGGMMGDAIDAVRMGDVVGRSVERSRSRF